MATESPGGTAEPLDLRPKAVRAWLEALPPTRPVDAAASLFERVHRVNRARIEADDRLEFVTACTPMARAVEEELRHLYMRSPLPLGDKPRLALAAGRALSTELALAYRNAALDKAGRRIAFGARRKVPALLLESIDWSARVIAASYRAYSLVPPGTWRQLHETYVAAAAHECDAEPVAEADGRTVEQAYCRTLLLSLSDPYRLRSGESDRIAEVAGFAMDAAVLARESPSTPARAHFLVACDGDAPPRPLGANAEDAGAHVLVLDLNNVVARLGARRAAARSGTPGRAMPPEDLALLEKLIGLWDDPPRRTFRRDASEMSVAVCAGIEAVRHYVDREGQPNAIEAAAIRSGITMPLLPFTDEDEVTQPPVLEWDVVNESAGGLRLRRSVVRQAISVGEVLGIRMMGRPRWIVGLVRWITAGDGGAFEFGMQFLAPGARAVWVRPTISASPQSKPGLLLERALRDASAEALLAPTGLFSEMRELEVDEAGESRIVRATEAVERTAKVDVFGFTNSG
jgi:cyclic-di-GMP-binding protein